LARAVRAAPARALEYTKILRSVMSGPLARFGGDITIVSSYTRQAPRSPAGLPTSRRAV
jgi:hypothetical protein